MTNLKYEPNEEIGHYGQTLNSHNFPNPVIFYHFIKNFRIFALPLKQGYDF